jgi:hypothetical protein
MPRPGMLEVEGTWKRTGGKIPYASGIRQAAVNKPNRPALALSKPKRAKAGPDPDPCLTKSPNPTC